MNANDPHHAQAAEEAALWRLRLEAEGVAEEDWLSFETWLSADPAHRAAYDALDQALIDIELNREEVLALAASPPPAQVLPFRPRATSGRIVWGAVAAIAASLVVGVFIARQPGPAVAYSAPASQDRVIALADGSEVHLNRNAAIEVRFGGGARRIELERGEASFRVAHDAANPFEVHVGGNVIRDVGTEFNIARNRQSVVVTVRSGIVEVSGASAAHETVTAGYQARLAPGGAIAVTQATPDDAFAWQSGRLVYHNATLSQVIEDLNRYSATPIVLATDRVAQLQFSGVLEIDNAAPMLARLQNFLPIRTTVESDRIVVKGID